jgi:hypothetical protein
VEERPKIKRELTPADRIAEFAGWLCIAAFWGLIATKYAALPPVISTHYNAAGHADGSGAKATILILPVIATVLFAGMTLLNQFPHIFNYPVKITKENALIQYTNATRMIRYLKLVIVVIFGFIAFQTIQAAGGHADGLGIGFLPLTLGLAFIPLTYFIIKSFKAR